ncbi:MAG: hypothetical protein HQ553_11295 [Chloroflexi bacterium]|nr:hypothetical protein [Chloroflexota bacterium]
MTALVITAVVLAAIGFAISIMAENLVTSMVSLAIWVTLMTVGFILSDDLVASLVWLAFAVIGLIGGWAIIDERQVKSKH